MNKSTVVPKATISKPAGAKAPDQQPPSQEAGPSSRAAASSASEEEEEEEDEDAEQINDSYGGQFASESEASVPDVDAPRVAQWEDDELEVNAESDGEEDEEEASEMPDSTLVRPLSCSSSLWLIYWVEISATRCAWSVA